MSGGHGCGTTLRNNGNDGFVNVEEHADGTVEITVGAMFTTLNRIKLTVNGQEATEVLYRENG